jgi:hypothetical protein
MGQAIARGPVKRTKTEFFAQPAGITDHLAA